MALSPDIEEMAKRYGMTRQPGQSETRFESWVLSMARQRTLHAQAHEWGASIPFGTTQKELRRALNQRLLKILEERGYTPDREVQLPRRKVKITKIVYNPRRDSEVLVHYWIIEPWSKPSNRGRANHTDAINMLKNGELLP